jgi:hypothetical protein
VGFAPDQGAAPPRSVLQPDAARAAPAGWDDQGLKALADAGVIRQLSAGTYDRQFAATELFDLLAA